MPIDVYMPQLSPTMTEGKIVRWLKTEGDELTSGEVMAEIETDKATMEMEVVDEGVLHRILQPEGSVVPVGAPIAVIAEEGEDVPGDYMPQSGEASAATAALTEERTQAVAEDPVAQAVDQPAKTSRIKVSPLARRMAKQEGLNLTMITGTGANGRITRADIGKAVRQRINLGTGASTIAPPARPLPRESLPYHADEFERIENSMMRKAIARRLVESKQRVPHFYLTIDVAMDRLMDLRAQLNDAAGGAFKLSVNDFIIKSVAKALVDVPAANASWTDTHTLQHKHAHISVAIAIKGGLMTPVIRFAERKSVVDISSEVKALAVRAQAGKLKPEEYGGGTFSISNLGMYGIQQFAAIVNPPEGAILAVGAAGERAVVEDSEVKVKNMMTLTLSCDHRVVDGAVGAEFMAALKKHLETPAGVLI